mgnify:CR=1 FL=1
MKKVSLTKLLPGRGQGRSAPKALGGVGMVHEKERKADRNKKMTARKKADTKKL